jgi:hypothetical protein
MADVRPSPTSRCPSLPGGSPAWSACLNEQDWYYSVRYQPADRYWTFQWLESAGYVALAGLLAGFAFWRIRRA